MSNRLNVLHMISNLINQKNIFAAIINKKIFNINYFNFKNTLKINKRLHENNMLDKDLNQCFKNWILGVMHNKNGA